MRVRVTRASFPPRPSRKQEWTPVRERLTTTLLRTISIALAVGGVIAARSHSLDAWPVWSLLLLWFSLGGHYLEVSFHNWLRPLSALVLASCTCASGAPLSTPAQH